MFYRSYGETKDCVGCRFWSEMIAKSNGSCIQAMCMNSNSDQSGKYKSGHQTCDNWASGHYGPIDSPGEEDEIISLYDEEKSLRSTSGT